MALSGSGTALSPYLIGTAADIAELATLINAGTGIDKYYKMTADIDLTGVDWVPIGDNTTTHSFDGDFNGDGHKITNLTCAQENAGLFGYIGHNSGTVYNVGIESGNISSVSSGKAGGICCGLQSNGEIYGCYNKAAIVMSGTGLSAYIGGIAAVNSGGNIHDCYNAGPITSNPPNACVGGVVGFATGAGTIVDCYNTGVITVSNSTYFGGICGKLESGATVTTCYYLDSSCTQGSTGSVSLTTVQMRGYQTNANMAFDFVSTWTAYWACYPILQAFIVETVYTPTTQIWLTPTGGTKTEVLTFDNVRTTKSTADRAGSFTFTIPSHDETYIDAIPYNTDVIIYQDAYRFRGYVTETKKSLDKTRREIEVSGTTYTGRTQNILINDRFTQKYAYEIIDELVTDYCTGLFSFPAYDRDTTKLDITFSDTFLYDALEQLSELTGFTWFVDYTETVGIFGVMKWLNPALEANRNATALSQSAGNYEGGSAEFTRDCSRLVNKLYVKGDIAKSNQYDIVDDIEYPIRFWLENAASQATYGVFEDIYKVSTTSPSFAAAAGTLYLDKYKDPIITGTIKPHEGTYSPGETVSIEIPDLNITGYYTIKTVTVDSVKGQGRIKRTIGIESENTTLTRVLKGIDARLKRLEKAEEGNSDTMHTIVPISATSATIAHGWQIGDTTTPTTTRVPNYECCVESLHVLNNRVQTDLYAPAELMLSTSGTVTATARFFIINELDTNKSISVSIREIQNGYTSTEFEYLGGQTVITLKPGDSVTFEVTITHS